MKDKILIISLVTSLFLGLVAHVAAQISKQDAASIAQSRFNGRVIAVKPEDQKGTLIYRVKVLDTNGGMHIVVIDGQSGKILSAH